MDAISMAGGKVYRTDYVVSSPDSPYAYIRVFDKDFIECATIFSDPAQTQTMSYAGQILEGYTNLQSISKDGDAIRIQMSNQGG